ncbi:MAG: lectin-like protein, partial [Bacteroidota bacterium]
GTALPIEIYYTFEGMEVFAGSFNSGSANAITGLASGEYSKVRIVDANGCQDVEEGPFVIGTPTGCNGSETLNCEDGSIIMSMERLRRNAVTMETINLPNTISGEVEVSALTFDEYTNRVNVTQLNEQVKIQFLSNGSVVAETGFTTDIPDQVVRGEIVTDFGTIDLGNVSVDQVKIVHADDPNSGFGSTDGSPNSVQGVEICIVGLLVEDDCCGPDKTNLFTQPTTLTQDGNGHVELLETFSIEGFSEIQLCSRFNSSGNLDQTGDYVDIFYKVDDGSFVKIANQNRDYSPCNEDTDPNRYDTNRTLSGVGNCSFDWNDYPIEELLPVTGDELTIKVVLAINGSERIDMTSLTVCGKGCEIEVDAGDAATVCDGETATFTATVSNFESCIACPNLGSDWTFIGDLDGIGYYEYNNGSKTYTEARNLATSEGGFLPIVTSQEINDFLEDNISSGIWIGFTDEDTEGTFVWEDGSPVSFTNWASGEPNNSGDEDYTELRTNGHWNDIPNNHQRSVVIQVSCPPSNDIEYTWSGPGNFSASTAEITVGTAGTYMVTVEDCNGCTATDAVVLEVDDTEITTTESTNKEICDGESVTFTVQTNATNPPYTDIEFIRFGSMVADPYTAMGGTFLGEFDLPAGSGSITTSDFPNTNPTSNETYFVYACVKPAPADGFCKPFVKYEVRVNDNPDVEVTKVDPDCDETAGTIKFTYTDHNNRGAIEFQLTQGNTVVEAYESNNTPDNSGMYSITGLNPGTYQASARWGNNDCEVDLGQVVIQPVPVVCDVPELCTDGIIIDFDTAPDGTPLVAGSTNFAA